LAEDELDPGCEARDERPEELSRLLARDAAVVGEQGSGLTDIGLGLLEHRHVESDERLAQVLVGAKAADGAPGETLITAAGLPRQTLCPYGREPTTRGRPAG
jgi:hypothetical protein